MLFLTVLVIALGWAGWFWAWGRDRYVSGSNLGLPPNPFAAAPTSPWSAPNNRARARLRRRQVIGTLVAFTLFGFVMARAWAPMWVPTVASLGFLVWYGWAVYRLENEGSGPTLESVQQRFGPVPDVDASRPVEAPAPARRSA